MNVEFAKELQALLEKYDACIYWTCSSCSDTHGIYDEAMVVEDKKDNVLFRIDGGCISAYDIQIELSE